MGKFIDLTGKQFGKLTVLQQAGKRNGKPSWVCRCACGNQTVVTGDNLRSEHTVSCGCYKSEKSKLAHTTHGNYGSRLHGVWRSMLQRCNDPAIKTYSLYGGRGIRVCEEWKNFTKFKEWAESNGYMYSAKRGSCTLDRIDVNGNYEPNNCRWISQREQSRNTNSNRVITYCGETHVLSEWAELNGSSTATLWARLNSLGWSFEKAIKTPVRKRKGALL